MNVGFYEKGDSGSYKKKDVSIQWSIHLLNWWLEWIAKTSSRKLLKI